jgi:hypothetical protein
MDNLFAWAAIYMAALIALPFFIVAYVKRQRPEPYPLSPKAEKRLFLLKLLFSEGMLGLWCYPMILHILVGDRSLLEIMNWQNTPSWALPVFLACGGIIFVAFMAAVAIDMYKSQRALKLRRAEQQVITEIVRHTPDHE